MPVLLRLKFLICTSTLLTIYFHGVESAQNVTGPGASACTYIGTSEAICDGMTRVPLEALPKSCTSFIYDGVKIDEKHQLHPPEVDEKSEYLNMIGSFGKKFYINIGNKNYGDWIVSILNDSGQYAMQDAIGINAFTSVHPGIKGLIFSNFDVEPDAVDFKVFSQKLFEYIRIIKRDTGLEVGLNFFADHFQDYNGDPNVYRWFVFDVLDAAVDFYILSIMQLPNDCSAKTIGGVTPIDGDAPYTLEKLYRAMFFSQILNSKVYFNIILGPTINRWEVDDICAANYQTLCAEPEKAKLWCADTLRSWYLKGRSLSSNGVGFVGSAINLDDPHNRCNCSSYPTFNAILAGFNRVNSPPSCPPYDRRP